MADLYYYEPDYIVPPGETISEMLEHYNMTQKELAQRIELTPKTINEIVKGKAPLSYQTASKLENVFGVEASFWNNLEKNYQEQLAEIEKKKRLQAQIDQAKEFPLNEMKKKGWITFSKDSPETAVDQLLKFFGVSSFEAMKHLKVESMVLEGAFRISPDQGIDERALTVWIRKGEIDAGKITTDHFSKELAYSKLNDLRSLTNEEDPSIFIPKLQEICSSFGVAVVFVPELKGCRVTGLTRWITGRSSQKAVIQLSLRHKKNDVLWFTFFHELGHVLLHDKKPYVEFSKYPEDKAEKEADDFAANTLIPEKALKEFISEGIYTRRSVVRFAENIGIHPGIAVGRLNKEKLLPWNQLQDLKVSYSW